MVCGEGCRTIGEMVEALEGTFQTVTTLNQFKECGCNIGTTKRHTAPLPSTSFPLFPQHMRIRTITTAHHIQNFRFF